MPNLMHGGVRIYYQFEGTGEPLVMLHGLSDSQWGLRALGYVEPLKERFQVILIDARGHGYSDKPHDPTAYTPALLAGDVLTVLDKLQIDQAHLFGYSLGGWIGLGLAQQAPTRLASLTIGGAHPYATNFSFYRSAFAQGIEAWITSLEHHHGPLPPTPGVGGPRPPGAMVGGWRAQHPHPLFCRHARSPAASGEAGRNAQPGLSFLRRRGFGSLCALLAQ